MPSHLNTLEYSTPEHEARRARRAALLASRAIAASQGRAPGNYGLKVELEIIARKNQQPADQT